MGMIPSGINAGMKTKIIEEYKDNNINFIGIDFNGKRPERLILRFIKEQLIRKYESV